MKAGWSFEPANPRATLRLKGARDFGHERVLMRAALKGWSQNFLAAFSAPLTLPGDESLLLGPWQVVPCYKTPEPRY